jgi:hypothetical protein
MNLPYCRDGVMSACGDSLWQTDDLATRLGGPDPGLWRRPASRTGFVPGILPYTFPTTSRPTFQQALELDSQGPRDPASAPVR